MSVNKNSGFEHLPSFSVELPSCSMPPWCSLHFFKQAIALSHSMFPVPLISHSCSVLFHFPFIFPCPHPFSTFSTHGFPPIFHAPGPWFSPTKLQGHRHAIAPGFRPGAQRCARVEAQEAGASLSQLLSSKQRAIAGRGFGSLTEKWTWVLHHYCLRNTTCIPFAICLWEHCKCTPLAPRTIISRN